MARPAIPAPRRITRSSTKFTSTSTIPDTRSSTTASRSRGNRVSCSDIEDAVPDSTSSTAQSRKRKRVATTTTITRRKVKNEAVGDDDDEVENAELMKMELLPEVARSDTLPSKSTGAKPISKITPDSSASSTTSTKPPSNWEEIYGIVRSMRSEGGAASNAPVDTMGCERLALRTATPRDQRFQTLVALMLSSQTKDTVNAVAMRRLQTELTPAGGGTPGLNLENVLAASPAHLNELIHGVGFHNNKTKYIQQAAAICRDAHGGDIPDTIEGLVALPGVGPKMAHLCLTAAWGRTEGIGVDVHVHRITNLWGWHGKGGSKNPEDTRAKLQAWLPRDRWHEINTLLVGLGQMVCVPPRPRCGDCELGLRGLCRAADQKKVLEGRKLRETVVKAEDGKIFVEKNAAKEEAVVKAEDDKLMVDVTVSVKEEVG
ncbi:DNA glycosylase [Xylaria sp. CBS 124048]|nr:DNA glycosylase [Xylaria sp. CBS 124048]